MKTTTTWIRLWGHPLLIGLLSMTGLVAALVGDGIFDVIAWLCLLYPLIRMSYHYWNKGNKSTSSRSIARTQEEETTAASIEELAYADKAD